MSVLSSQLHFRHLFLDMYRYTKAQPYTFCTLLKGRFSGCIWGTDANLRPWPLKKTFSRPDHIFLFSFKNNKDPEVRVNDKMDSDLTKEFSDHYSFGINY